jgi:membrane protease YdiL (CAAX protease family)
MINLKKEFNNLKSSFNDFDRKVIIIFLSVGILQTISWYFTSRRFFRDNLFESFQNLSNPYLMEYLYWFIGDFITLFVIPLIIIKFTLKDRIVDFGLKIGDWKAGLSLSLLFLLIMLPAIWVISASPEFVQKYPHLLSARDSWRTLFIYEMGMLIYMIAWEFIWRGFMLFGLEKKFGNYAVLMQMIPFVILHNGKPFVETFGAIFGGIALGILALRTRSIYYCILTHIGIMYSIDIISTIRYRVNEYGVGIDSLINLIKYIF